MNETMHLTARFGPKVLRLTQDEDGWWLLNELFEGGPPMRFLFENTAYVCFQDRLKTLHDEFTQSSGGKIAE